MKESTHIKLVNPNVSEKAIKLFNFIQDIQGKYTLSGQHNFISFGSKYMDEVESITGKRPVIWGSDFSWDTSWL